jgi:hypothetical protein
VISVSLAAKEENEGGTNYPYASSQMKAANPGNIYGAIGLV